MIRDRLRIKNRKEKIMLIKQDAFRKHVFGHERLEAVAAGTVGSFATCCSSCKSAGGICCGDWFWCAVDRCCCSSSMRLLSCWAGPFDAGALDKAATIRCKSNDDDATALLFA